MLSISILALLCTACQNDGLTAPAQAPVAQSPAVVPSPSASPAPSTAVVPAAPITSRLSPTQCMDALGGGSTPGTKVGIYTCNSGASQQFAWTTTGEIHHGSLCVDASGGAGNNGDRIILYTCNGGANQHWSPSASGQIRGINGRCIDIPASNTKNSTQLIIYDCNGGVNQSWDGPAISAAIAAASVSGSRTQPIVSRSAVLDFMAAAGLPGVNSVQAKGGAFGKYETDFTHYADYQWGIDSTSFGANFYDRAMIYYVWWARTGNATYLDRANKLAVQARTDIESWNYYPLTYNLMLDGVALHALVTGDARSALTVAKVADNLANPHGWFSYVAGHAGDAEGDSRNSARILNGVLDAQLLKVKSPAGYNYAALLPDLAHRIIGTQSADGAYRWPNQCNFDKPFMTGMLNEALIRYYTSFQADRQIVPAVQKAVDYMWAHDWVPADQGFRYIGSPNGCSNPSSGGTGGATADLNSLIVSGFAFVAKQTGDASYLTKGDAAFAGAVKSAWLPGPKQFNQAYTSSYRYLALRF